VGFQIASNSMFDGRVWLVNSAIKSESIWKPIIVTGIMAGSNRSGDLADGAKSIPLGKLFEMTSQCHLTSSKCFLRNCLCYRDHINFIFVICCIVWIVHWCCPNARQVWRGLGSQQRWRRRITYSCPLSRYVINIIYRAWIPCRTRQCDDRLYHDTSVYMTHGKFT